MKRVAKQPPASSRVRREPSAAPPTAPKQTPPERAPVADDSFSPSSDPPRFDRATLRQLWQASITGGRGFPLCQFERVVLGRVLRRMVPQGGLPLESEAAAHPVMAQLSQLWDQVWEESYAQLTPEQVQRFRSDFDAKKAGLSREDVTTERIRTAGANGGEAEAKRLLAKLPVPNARRPS